MKKPVLVCMMLSIGFCGSLLAQGNRAASMEYLQSSSPLKTGGSVTAYSTPGTGVVTSISSTAGTNPLGSAAPRSVLQTPTAGSVPPANQLAANPYATAQGAFDPYLSTAPSAFPAPGPGFNRTSNSFRPGLFGIPRAQPQPFLGLPPIDLPAASLAPQINPPGSGAASPPALQLSPSSPVLLSGQTPVPGYPPMPPGVYNGKSIFGQPKAYVDGQPARNFLRFIFP